MSSSCVCWSIIWSIKNKPVYLQNLLTTTASVPGRTSNRSASNNDLVRQSTRLKLGERAFFVAGPCVWN